MLTDHESPTNRDYSDELVKTESFKADQMSSSGNTTAISERSPHDDTTSGQQVKANIYGPSILVKDLLNPHAHVQILRTWVQKFGEGP